MNGTAAFEPLLTVAEVADQLRTGDENVRRLAAAGRLRGSRISGRGRGGKTWRFRQSDVNAYLASCQPDSTALVVEVAFVDDGHARRRTRRKAS